MAVLNFQTTQPPGGWTHFQRETEFHIKGDDAQELIDLVVKHRVYRNLPRQSRDEVWLDIQRQICVRLTRQECSPEDKNDPWKPQGNERVRVTMGDVLAFSKASLAWVASGFELAPLEEVKRRADICRKCPMNAPMSGCSCDTFYKAIDAAVSQERRQAGLHVCGACHCSLVAKVNLTEKQVIESNVGRGIVWPQGVDCWQEAIEKNLAKVE